MRYFATPQRETIEAQYIQREFGKRVETAAIELRPECVINQHGTSLVDVGGRTLAIHPDIGGWAFLCEEEAALLRKMNGITYGALGETESGRHPGLDEFVSRLHRRGLVSLDGCYAIDLSIFQDSPNYHEGNLVELLVTEKCNLACGYCLAGANTHMPAMTRDVARRAVDLAFGMTQAEVIAFEFSGGEPFLRFPLMQELVGYIQNHPCRRGRRIYLNIQSNGTLFDAERVRWIKENQIRIGISLDGQPSSQNTSRPQVNGKESFPRLIDGINLLQQHEIPFGALVVLNRSNIDSVMELVDFLLDNDIRSFKLNPVSYLGTARANWDSIGLTSGEVIGYFTALIELIGTRGYPLLESNILTMLRFLTSKQRSTRCMRSHCGAGDTFQAISAAGDIYPCGRATQTPRMKLGNVSDVGLTSLAEPARENPHIVQIRARRPETLEGCDVCEYRQFCQAGCSVQAFERYGTVRHRTPECDFFKTLYPHLMRTLSFDRVMFEVFQRIGYFGNDGVLFDRDYASPISIPVGK